MYDDDSLTKEVKGKPVAWLYSIPLLLAGFAVLGVGTIFVLEESRARSLSFIVPYVLLPSGFLIWYGLRLTKTNWRVGMVFAAVIVLLTALASFSNRSNSGSMKKAEHRFGR